MKCWHYSERNVLLIILVPLLFAAFSNGQKDKPLTRVGTRSTRDSESQYEPRLSRQGIHSDFGDRLFWQMVASLFNTSAERSKPLEQPYSGETIRIRSSEGFINSGLVEVYRDGQWGYVCDKGWDLTDANVACEQLGFPKGAFSVTTANESLTQSQLHSTQFLMQDVKCTGTETTLHECPFSKRKYCTGQKAAALTCHPNEGCPDEWVSGFEKCYRFYSKAKTIKLAGSVCARENGILLTVDSIKENHFLSNVLKHSFPDIHQWYTGGQKITKSWQWTKLILDPNARYRNVKGRRKQRNSALRTATSALAFDKWFPGWTSHNNIHAEPRDVKSYDCLTLSDQFQNSDNVATTVDYFYWKADKCRNIKGIHFICQKDKEHEKETSVSDCYTEKGSTYNGTVAVTEHGNACLSWVASDRINEKTHPGKGLGDHNYCRNPDDDARPWCWISHVKSTFGFCNIPKCSYLTNTETTTESNKETSTDAPDCYTDNGSTYNGTVAVTEHGKPCLSWADSDTINERTYPGKGLGDHNYCRNPDDDVRPWCWISHVNSKYGFCNISKCSPLSNTESATESNKESSTDAPDDCSGKFKCTNKKCVNLTDRCNGKFDCEDRSDETDCFADIQVKLVGGDKHSGTVEITYQGTKGLICDDEWSIQDATVICRMLGYRAAERETKMNFFNYPVKNVNFLLDDVSCIGNEMSIKDCNKKPWNDHDCATFEIAGVVCRRAEVCEVDQFKCHNNLCVLASEICNKKDDCGDNSDELYCQSLRIQLVNGSVPWEGRVEILRNGFRGTICDDQWDDKDASVVCQLLGFMHGGEAMQQSYFGAGNGPIWLDNVQCTSSETSLEDCSHRGWANHDCDHTEDAGVKCFHIPPPEVTTKQSAIAPELTTESPSILEIKLVGGKDDSEGNVEVIFKDLNYRVCDNYWDDKEAIVICRMLGFSAGGLATQQSFFGSENVSIIFDNVHCAGTERDITQCSAVVGVHKHGCNASDLAGVICDKSSRLQKLGSGVRNHAYTTSGKCGIRPYDYQDLMKSQRKRRSLVPGTDEEIFTSNLPRQWFFSRHDQQKIVGGAYAVYGAYPWQVRVQQVLSITADGSIYGIHHCGAAVISEFWILSAAHCFVNKRKSEFRLIVGDYHQDMKDMGEQVFSVVDIVIHELYDDYTKDYDIALLKVQRTPNGHGIVFNNFVQPACLPDASTPFIAGTRCMISGWGNVNPKIGEYPKILKAIEVPLISQRQCEYLYTQQTRGYLSNRMFCAGYIQGGIDTCDGDSGGPLVCRIADVYTIVGITSWGRGCAMPNLPGVYTRVTTFLSWIDEKLKSHSKNNESYIPSKP